MTVPALPSTGPPRPARLEPSARAALQGLTAAEAFAARERFGPNVLAPPPRAPWLRELWRGVASPLVAILMVASGIAALAGERVDAAIIVLMIALSVSLDVVQSWRSQRAALRIRESVSPTATVCRDGAWREMARGELVPGDLIRLVAGDLVPADAQIVEARDLRVHQAALTGEAMPAEKEVVAGAISPNGDPSRRDLVFLGTSVVSGTANAVVTATGRATAFGEIAVRLAERPPETAFERGLRSFGLLLTRTVVFLVLFLVVVSVALHRDPLESLLFAVALAVGIVPEFMPMITSVTLASGAVRMARRRVVVRHLAAIQNLGGMDVLCSDKTGTLTRGEMTLDEAVDADGAPSARASMLAALNARFQSGIRSPLDEALLRDAPAERDAAWEKLDELPFDFERRCVSVVVRRGGEPLLVCKGAPETVLERCAAYEPAAGAPLPLDRRMRERVDGWLAAAGSRGLRVLAVASRSLPMRTAYDTTEERELALVGFVAFGDPPLPDAAQAVAALRDQAVVVKMISGDAPEVARWVAERTGIDASRVVIGDEIGAMDDGALGAVAEQASVFARVSPQQKLRIILALEGRGHVVGYLGDGINDAPSIHAADVGISVASATDVAREAADIVLLERSLDVLRTGILEGRRAFGNVMKYLLMGASSGFGNMLSMATASLVLPFLPMLPTQILLNNFLYDAAQVAIPTDRVDEEYLRAPRQWAIAAVRRFMLLIGPISSLFDWATFAMLLLVFRVDERGFHTGWYIESLATQILVLFVIRTARSPWRSRASRAFTLTAIVALLAGVALPFSPVAPLLGFVPPPAGFAPFLLLAVPAYLALVQLAKGRVMRALVGGSGKPRRDGPVSRTDARGGSM